jgi:hypothetical protein
MDLLSKLGMDSWPETIFVLVNNNHSYATARITVTGHTIEENQLMWGLACFENEKQALAAAVSAEWLKHKFHAQKVTFDEGIDIAKSKSRLSCMILHRISKDLLVFNL